MIPLFFLLLVNEGRWHLFVEEVAHRVDDIRRGVRHASGWARRSGRRVRLKPCSKGWPATPRKRSAKRQRIRGYQSGLWMLSVFFFKVKFLQNSSSAL